MANHRPGSLKPKNPKPFLDRLFWSALGILGLAFVISLWQQDSPNRLKGHNLEAKSKSQNQLDLSSNTPNPSNTNAIAAKPKPAEPPVAVPEFLKGDFHPIWRKNIAEKIQAVQRAPTAVPQLQTILTKLAKEKWTFAPNQRENWHLVKDHSYQILTDKDLENLPHDQKRFLVGHRLLVPSKSLLSEKDFGQAPLVIYDRGRNRVGFLNGSFRIYTKIHSVDLLEPVLLRNGLQLVHQVGSLPIYVVKSNSKGDPLTRRQELGKDSDIDKVEVVIEQDLLKI